MNKPPRHFKTNLRFALHKESSKMRDTLPLNLLEKIGNTLSWFAYEFRSSFSKTICDLRCITICFTSLAMFFTSLIFYPSLTWDYLLETCIWIVDHINWSYVRLFLWLLSELTIFGLGIRALGRFSNQDLIKYYGISITTN